MSRPVASRRPVGGAASSSSGTSLGGTSLGTPLRTRVVTASATAQPVDSGVGRAAVGAGRRMPAASPTRTTAASSSSSSLQRTPLRAAPSKTPVKGFGSSLAPRASPSATAASSSTAHASSSSSSSSSAGPSASPKQLSRQRYDSNKTINPFATKTKFKTTFSEAYSNGSIPCRINHGSVHLYLQWDRPASELPYHTLLPVVADGLCEVVHPYVTIARKAFAELVAEGGQARVVPLLPQLIHPLRRALLDPAAGVFEAGCDAIAQLSRVVGPLLNAHLDLLLQQINKKSMQKAYAQKVADTINTLAENGGDEAIKKIKAKVPSFTGF